MTLVFCRCPANATLLLLRRPIFNYMIIPGNQTQITPTWNKKTLTKFKDVLDNLSLKLLCDVIFLSLPGQSDIACFTVVNFQSDEYSCKQNFSNYTKLKIKASNYKSKTFQKILVWSCCVTSFFRCCPSNGTLPSFKMVSFQLNDIF